jgi:uncharacterized repeat protein (TIGR01451 family)
MKTKLLFMVLCAGTLFLSSCSKNDPVLSSDLTVKITASTLTPEVGSNVTFTIVAHNNGPDDASGVDVTDNLPTGYTFISKTPTAGTLTDRAWVIGNLKSGASETLTVVATVLAQGVHTYSVSILGAQPDPNSLNGISEVVVVPKQPYVDMAVSLTVSNTAPNVGDDVTFVITVKNDGLIDASGVAVNNALPAGYAFVSAAPSVGTWTAPTWTIGGVNNGASATLSIVAKVNPTGSYANAATVTSTETDSNTGNNTATIATVPIPPVTAKITYDHDIKSIFVTSCTPCHLSGGTHPKKWDDYTTAKANISNIISRVSKTQGSSGFMPKGGTKLSDTNIALLNQWVTDGLLEK